MVVSGESQEGSESMNSGGLYEGFHEISGGLLQSFKRVLGVSQKEFQMVSR